MPKNYCIMQIRAEPEKTALPICNYSQILYQFLTFTQNLKRSLSHPDANDLEYKNPLELNFYPVQEDFLFFTFLANSLKDYNFSNFSKNAT